jgi:Protein of unknown function (DUF1592)/Protein of unknown function (DUF1587)/Protein of unknown function (DUF1595)
MKHGAFSLLLTLTAVLSAAPARRLNRYEYDCTIRDLVGVDFRAGDNFPADNFSYGFDNNAATLTVTPALLTKYLDAARKIARAAIEPVLPPSTPDLERRSNASASADITWERNFIWEGDYEAHIAIAGRSDPFALNISVDDGEPQRLPVSVDFEGRRYADTRLHMEAGVHRWRIFVVRDEDRSFNQRDQTSTATPPYPEYVEARGPYGLVLPGLPRGYSLVFSCGHAPGHHTSACVRGNLENLARRAWRRTVTPAEIDKLMGLVAAARTNDAKSEQQNLQQQMETGLEAILVSPSFLFRIENPDSARGNDFVLASRLSYFLWSSMPDEELLRTAERRQLTDPAVLAAQARRMLADPKSHALAENFAAQWLEFRNLDFIHRDPARFPEFNPDLRDAMRKETELFVSTSFKRAAAFSIFWTGNIRL